MFLKNVCSSLKAFALTKNRTDGMTDKPTDPLARKKQPQTTYKIVFLVPFG